MNAAEKKAVVRCLMEEALGRGDVGLIPELVAAAHVGHLPIGDHYGPEGVRIDIVADGDKVVRQVTPRGTHRLLVVGAPAGGGRVSLHGIAIDHLVRGQLVESWIQVDVLPGAR